MIHGATDHSSMMDWHQGISWRMGEYGHRNDDVHCYTWILLRTWCGDVDISWNVNIHCRCILHEKIVQMVRIGLWLQWQYVGSLHWDESECDDVLMVGPLERVHIPIRTIVISCMLHAVITSFRTQAKTAYCLFWELHHICLNMMAENSIKDMNIRMCGLLTLSSIYLVCANMKPREEINEYQCECLVSVLTK